jgi:GNAT superfamily N-acetyltransferase
MPGGYLSGRLRQGTIASG